MKRSILALVAPVVLVFGTLATLNAQQPQIPTLQVCNVTGVKGSGFVKIPRRSDAAHLGTFEVRVELRCDPRAGYPAGTLSIKVDMSDSVAQGLITATALEQVTSTGKHTPTAYINGRCKADQVSGCRFWLTLTDNKRLEERAAPDIVGFLVLNGVGQRVAYGFGPVVDGDIVVAPTSN